MKKINLKSLFLSFRSQVITISFLLIIILSVSFLSSCKKDGDTKNSSIKDDPSMKEKSTDSMHKDMDKKMDNMMDKHMSTMMNKMKEMKMSGNTDVDFVTMMIMHHEGAINMAKSEIESGKDEKIKSMANNIIKDQQKEIETMQIWLAKNKDRKSTSGDNSKKLMESMDSMMDPGMKMTGSTDKDFVTMMISHHKGAIDMAEVEAGNGTDPEVKKMAEDIIKETEKRNSRNGRLAE